MKIKLEIEIKNDVLTRVSLLEPYINDILLMDYMKYIKNNHQLIEQFQDFGLFVQRIHDIPRH